jgi:hypothetical protein
MAKRLEVQIVGDSRDFERSLGKAESATHKFGKAAGLAGLAIAGTLVVALKKSVEAAMDAQVSQSKMENQLKALGISYKQHGAQIEDVIQKVSRLSALDDEDLQDSFTSLVRTTKDVDKALTDAALAADVSRGKHISLEAATKLVTAAELGKAGALTRSGIEVEKGATSIQLLGALHEKFAGQAEAYGKTAAGAQERFQVAVENLQEAIGNRLLPVLTKLLTKATEITIYLTDNLGPSFDKVREALGHLKFVADALGKWLTIEFKAYLFLVKAEMKLVELGVDAAKAAFNGVKSAANSVATFFTGTLNGAINATKGVVDKVGAALDAVGSGFRAAVTAGRAAATWLTGAATKAFNGFKDIVDGLAAAFRAVERAVLAVVKAISSIHMPSLHLPSVGGAIGKIGSIIPHAAGGIVTSPHIGLVGEAGPEAIIPLGRGGGGLGLGGGLTVQLFVGTVIGGDYKRVAQELVQPLVDELAKHQLRGGLVVTPS